MINKIFWDIDETLIHSEVEPFGEGYNDIPFTLDDGTYYTVIRPSSYEVINFSRDLVGADNVYILTSATLDYTREINRIANWGFSEDHIFSREDMISDFYATDEQKLRRSEIISADNVLIDNLPSSYNKQKMNFIGIGYKRYLNVMDYYGVDFPDCCFVEDVKNFLLKLHNAK